MRRRLYIGIGNDVSLRIACLPRALIVAFSFKSWRNLAKASLRNGVRLYLIEDDFPVSHRTGHALRRVRPDYRTLSVEWLNRGRRPVESFPNAHCREAPLGGPSVGTGRRRPGRGRTVVSL